METREGKQAFKREKFLFNDIIHHLIFLIRRSSLMGALLALHFQANHSCLEH